MAKSSSRSSQPSKAALSKAGRTLASNSSSKPAKSKASSTLGKGCIFSALSVGIFQGTIFLLAGFLEPVMTPASLKSLSAVGNILIFCVGTNLFGLPAMAPLEAELGVPVIDSAAAGVWGALRAVGAPMADAGRLGRIFTLGG